MLKMRGYDLNKAGVGLRPDYIYQNEALSELFHTALEQRNQENRERGYLLPGLV
ncbi:MAG TPA: hypothetical protein VFV38_31570 [Ktedonobacteraceae bacterium]|nr:hypothetical protein [Ktedonobacteraceae bacterium]